MNDTPMNKGHASDEAQSAEYENRPVTHGNPALQRAGERIRVVTLVLGALVILGIGVWMMVASSDLRVLTGLWAMASVAAMAFFSVGIVKRVFNAAQASLPAWLGIGYLGRILIVAFSLIGGRLAGAEVRIIGIALIVMILLSTLAEVWMLSRARILNVVPLDTSH